MFGFFRQCVEGYCEMAKIKPETPRKVATPGMDDHQLKPEDFEQDGYMSKDPVKTIMEAPGLCALSYYGQPVVARDK